MNKKYMYRKLHREQTVKRLTESIESIPNIFKYGTSKTKNKTVQRALNSDIVGYILEKTHKKAKNKLNNLFGSF